ncbi:methyl-accepting chemotaxis protein [Thalassotalea ganghwensis]
MSISKKLLVYLLGSISILLLISSVIVVSSLAQDSRESVRTELTNIVQIESDKIMAFFTEKGKRLETLFRNPAFTQWLDAYQDKDHDTSEDQQYNNMIKTFTAESSSDASIKSIFFAHDRTGVYFYEKGTHWVEGYNLTGRSWYVAAVEKDTLNIGKMDLDSIDQSIYTAIYSPLKNSRGELIGLAGMDILLQTMADIVSNTKYRGQGQALLINKNGEVMYMPPVDGQEPLPLNGQLSLLDENKGNSGFGELKTLISQTHNGRSTVTLAGVEQEVTYIELDNAQPEFTWVLALMVPSQLVEEKVNQSITTSIIFIIIILAAITAVVLIVTRSIVKPLVDISDAMADIAHGDGDLTKRIDIKSNDEVGTVAKEFNHFVERIHELVIQVSGSSQGLNQTIEDFSVITEQAAERSQSSTIKASEATSIVDAVANSAQTIATNAQEASVRAQEASESALTGQKGVETSVDSIAQMASTIEDATSVIATLRQDSESIGEVLNVIRGVAEQTNLLALNAAIEAARAGEQGRGFAVVADEVRTLASRTQESTNNIQQMIENLQSSSKQAESVMDSSQQQMHLTVEQVNNISEIFKDILVKITDVQEQNEYIAQSTEEQTQATVEMSATIESFKQMAEKGQLAADSMKGRCQDLTNNAQELNTVVSRFKL